MHWWTIFPFKSLRDQIWPCHKIGRRQPRVIIWKNLIDQVSLQLAKQFWNKRFFKCFYFPYMALVAILIMWSGPFEQIFIHLLPGRLYMKFNWNSPSRFRENALWNVDGPAIKVTRAKVSEWPWPLALTDIYIVPTLMSQTTRVFEKSIVWHSFTFILYLLSCHRP